MMIDAIGSVTPAITTQQDSRQINDKESDAAISVDKPGIRTTLTSGAASVSSLVAQAMQVPAIRQGYVEDLRLSIRGGQYRIDPGEIAASILQEQANRAA